MSTIKEEQHIAGLILKERTLGLSPAERQELAAWRAANPANEQIYARMSRKDFRQNLEKHNKIDVASGLARYHKHQRETLMLHRIHIVAAVAAVFLLIAGTVFLMEQPETAVIQNYATITPGSPKAMLILANGQSVDLTEQGNAEITLAENLKVANNGKEIDYTMPDSLNKDYANVYNELRIPKGGEFSITLSDGTKVWVNSETKFKYPVTFGQHSREVFLEGEAYFEVAKDKKRPFLIKTKDDVQIEVLGTSFNVKSYPDEKQVETVLEEGCVKMSCYRESVLLEPGYKASYSPGEKIQMEKVDTELYTSWRQGQYFFKQENLENILKQLARWYDIEIVYQDESLRSLLFSGSVEKYDNIGTLLDAMAIVGKVNFNVKGKTITVTQQK